MKELQRTSVSIGIGVTLILAFLALAAPGLFTPAEDEIRAAKYALRGTSTIDSSVVILYLDNDDIASLGGLPLRRSYYALIIDVLRNLGAASIGIDIAFTESDLEHPEYDQLLATEISAGGTIVLGGYFRSLHNDRTVLRPRLPDRFAYGIPETAPFPRGNDLEVPIPLLMKDAASFGHTNITERSGIPVFIMEGGKGTPSFALEILRIAMRAERSSVRVGKGGVDITTAERSVRIPMTSGGEATVNFCGGVQSLRVYPVVDFLKSYDAWKTGGETELNVESLRGTMVLIGIIAEGRSGFSATPFTSQFPAIGIHAMFLHNCLRGDFLTVASPWLTAIVTFMIGVFCVVILTRRRPATAAIAVGAIVVAFLAVSWILFASLAIDVPTVPGLLAALMVSGIILVARHEEVRSEMDRLSADKTTVMTLLHEREQRLRSLEEDLARSKQPVTDTYRLSMEEEIRRYREEIAAMRTRADDLQPFDLAAAVPGEEVVEKHGMMYHAGGPMADIIMFIEKIATSDAAVLILGESGTGKELVAKALHASGKRCEKPFVAVNCGALTETLLESELFGHVRGAFTGAVKDKPGRFELADGGTIFLDEIAETSESFQVKLLRVLQEGTFERVGGTETVKVNVRVTAATNRDIRDAVARKDFREDLYYRLNVFTIALPPLRHRLEDIPLLTRKFVTLENPNVTVSATVMHALQHHPWKGNVRELQSVLKRAVLMAKSDGRDIIRLKDLPDEIAGPVTTPELEESIVRLLREKGFARSAIQETAEELGGLNRGTVAEHFRGYCFKMFAEHKFQLDATVEAIAASADATVRERVRKKVSEYLSNGLETVDKSKSLEEVTAASKPKYKNLPQKYHPFLDAIIVSFYNGTFTITLNA